MTKKPPGKGGLIYLIRVGGKNENVGRDRSR